MKSATLLAVISLLLAGCQKTQEPYVFPENESIEYFGTYSGFSRFETFSSGGGQIQFLNVVAEITEGSSNEEINLAVDFSDGESRFYEDLKMINKKCNARLSDAVFLEVSFIGDATLRVVERTLFSSVGSSTYEFTLEKD